MDSYEVLIEDINPCGGERHGKQSFLEIETASPEAYVRENSRFPITDVAANAAGDLIITTADGKGSMIRYTFTK